MKSYRGLSLRYLKKQKKRTLLTVIGIILSVALLCAAGIMGESLKNNLVENTKQMYGDFHVSYENLDLGQIGKLQRNLKVDGVGYYARIGTSTITKTQKLLLMAGNPEMVHMVRYELASGRLPEKAGEIVLEQWILDNMKERPALGDTFRLDFTTESRQNAGGETASGKSPGGGRTESREFRLVGTFKNTDGSMVMGMSFALVGFDTAREILKEDTLNYETAVRIRGGMDYQEVIRELNGVLQADPKKVHQNTAVLSIESQGRNNSVNRSVFLIQLILISVIILSTVAVIFNSFQISVLERIHQFGVLRSVGATPRQINRIVLGEALLLAVVSIPPGLACGVLGVKTVIGLFSLQSSAFFGSMKVIIHWQTIVFASLLGLMTILASAFAPAITAARVSPLEAVLNRSRGVRKRLKVNRLFPARIFRMEGVMAGRNLGRNRKRLFVTVFSMSVGIILFIFFNTFIAELYMELDTSFRKDFSLDKPFSSNKPGFTNADYKYAASIPGVKTVYRLMQKESSVLLPSGQTTEEYRNIAGDKFGGLNYDLNGAKYYRQPSAIYGYRDSELGLCRKSLTGGRIDSARMNQVNGVLVSQGFYFKEKDDIVQASDLKVGDQILMLPGRSAVQGEKPVRLTVVGILEKMPLVYTADSPVYGLITTEEVFRRITGIDTFTRFDIELNKGAQLNLVSARLSDVKANVEEGRLLEFSESSMKTIGTQISVILFGLVTVISIIGALNIINTISTNLILRIREFGTLRAVGMDPDQMRRMIALEGIFYGLLASIYGTAAGFLLSKILHNNINEIKALRWQVPWDAAAEACAAAILIGLLASLVPLKRIAALNITESIRAEE